MKEVLAEGLEVIIQKVLAVKLERTIFLKIAHSPNASPVDPPLFFIPDTIRPSDSVESRFISTPVNRTPSPLAPMPAAPIPSGLFTPFM